MDETLKEILAVLKELTTTLNEHTTLLREIKTIQAEHTTELKGLKQDVADIKRTINEFIHRDKPTLKLIKLSDRT